MKRISIVSLIALLAIVVGPVVLHQMNPGERRALEGESLDPARFEEVRFRNETQAIDLAGMLFAPPGPGPFPAAVIIHGSGTSSRGNRWYLTLTHFLQDNGIAVLLPDKRGSEQSGGDWRQASFEDLATDTLAAIQFLETQDRVEVSRIGVIGMSQGGWIAPIVAERAPRLSFLVDVVGAAVSTHQQFLYEEEHNLRQMGVLPGLSKALARLSTSVHRTWVQNDFWSAVGDFDPLPYWRKLDLPALVLYGEIDTNVPTAKSAALLRGLNHPHVEVKVYAGSGHPLEDPPDRGNRLFRQDALADIREFILSRGTAESKGAL
jgi:dipeptidyl aminopeptidase/acylaminoacyl peptidase